MSDDIYGQDMTVEELVEVVQREKLYTSMKAIAALAALGDRSVEPLMQMLTRGEHSERWRAAIALARVGQHSVEPLINAAVSQTESVRNPAVWALAEIGDPRAVQPLISILHNEDSECCRILTAAALLKIGDPAGVTEVHREYDRSGEDFIGKVTEAREGS
ncbi:MAG: HEAT repeat domain-containing protein [Methanomicrobiaceae archaeon]|nr:HEAT repeat domain-containing protein [Methanomicrobiaceae archaeon]